MKNYACNKQSLHFTQNQRYSIPRNGKNVSKFVFHEIPTHDVHSISFALFLQSCASNDTFTHIPIWHSFETNKSINKLRKIIVISFGRLADNLRIDVFFSPCERKRNHIITKCVVCSTFFYDLFSASPSLPIHLPNCMQVNQSANICILIMWLLRLNAHHKFGLCVANHIFYPSHSSSSSIQTTSLCLLLFVYTSQCVCVGALTNSTQMLFTSKWFLGVCQKINSREQKNSDQI